MFECHLEGADPLDAGLQGEEYLPCLSATWKGLILWTPVSRVRRVPTVFECHLEGADPLDAGLQGEVNTYRV